MNLSSLTILAELKTWFLKFSIKLDWKDPASKDNSGGPFLMQFHKSFY